MSPVEIPSGRWDPETYRPPPCAQCGELVDIEWIELQAFGAASGWRPGPVSCPTSRYHDTSEARRIVTPAVIAHPELDGLTWCPLSELNHWRQHGWYAVDPAHQTPTEAVDQRVADLRRAAEL